VCVRVRVWSVQRDGLVVDWYLPPLALRPGGQAREAASLDPGAHQRGQPQPDGGRDGAALQALPAPDGPALQTGRSHALQTGRNHALQTARRHALQTGRGHALQTGRSHALQTGRDPAKSM